MTAEELLQNTEDSELHEASNEVFVIDNDLRTIFVPESISNIGVESDDDVNRLYFQMPKQYGEFDLSEFNIRINYMNADNKGDIYAVTDKEVFGDNITFSWLVGRTAFAKKGNVRFIVCLKKTDDEGSVQKEFNTTVATLAVLEGLETSEQIVQENPDIIEEILKRLDTLETTGGGGTPGKDGREIEIQNNGTAIQWRYVGDESWTDLVQLSDLKGQKGDPGENGTTPTIGENGNWYLGKTDTGKPSRGTQGPAGRDGDQGPEGPKGEKGATPNIKIGTVQTLEPGQQATASISGTPENPLLNLGIPKGENGDSEITVQQMQNTDSTVTLQPNILYIFPEMSTLDVTIPETDQEVHFFFDSGATATVFSLQSQDSGQIYTDAYSIDANMRYEVSVLHSVAYIKGVSTDAA